MHYECEEPIYMAGSFRDTIPETRVMLLGSLKYYQVAPNTSFKGNRLVPCIVIHSLYFSWHHLLNTCVCALCQWFYDVVQRVSTWPMNSLHYTETLFWDLKWVVRHAQTFLCIAIFKAFVMLMQNLSEAIHCLAESSGQNYEKSKHFRIGFLVLCWVGSW